MPFIPRQVKPPTRVAITCKLPVALATLLKRYAEFLDSSQEYVIAETVRLACRRDKEFHAWLAANHPELRAEDGAAGSTEATPAVPVPATSPRRPTSVSESSRTS